MFWPKGTRLLPRAQVATDAGRLRNGIYIGQIIHSQCASCSNVPISHASFIHVGVNARISVTNVRGVNVRGISESHQAAMLRRRFVYIDQYGMSNTSTTERSLFEVQ